MKIEPRRNRLFPRALGQCPACDEDFEVRTGHECDKEIEDADWMSKENQDSEEFATIFQKRMNLAYGSPWRTESNSIRPPHNNFFLP